MMRSQGDMPPKVELAQARGFSLLFTPKAILNSLPMQHPARRSSDSESDAEPSASYSMGSIPVTRLPFDCSL
jgi:hypothetical protein